MHHSPLKLAMVSGLLLLALPLQSLVQAQEKEKKPTAKRGSGGAKSAKAKADVEEESDPDEAKEQEGESKGLEIGKLLPLNKANLRVKIPGFDKGELASMVEAEKLTRIDDKNLELVEATIQLIPQALLIKLRSALYNTEGAMLSSDEATTISSKQFTMTGESMDFDTRSGKGRMLGRVRMIIHNIDAMGDSPGAQSGEPADGKSVSIQTEEEQAK